MAVVIAAAALGQLAMQDGERSAVPAASPSETGDEIPNGREVVTPPRFEVMQVGSHLGDVEHVQLRTIR